jgi:hypothetical protein
MMPISESCPIRQAARWQVTARGGAWKGLACHTRNLERSPSLTLVSVLQAAVVRRVLCQAPPKTARRKRQPLAALGPGDAERGRAEHIDFIVKASCGCRFARLVFRHPRRCLPELGPSDLPSRRRRALIYVNCVTPHLRCGGVADHLLEDYR